MGSKFRLWHWKRQNTTFPCPDFRMWLGVMPTRLENNCSIVVRHLMFRSSMMYYRTREIKRIWWNNCKSRRNRMGHCCWEKFPARRTFCPGSIHGDCNSGSGFSCDSLSFSLAVAFIVIAVIAAVIDVIVLHIALRCERFHCCPR